MRPVWILALAASGCRGILGIGEAVVIEDDAAIVDVAIIDARPDTPAVCVPWQPQGLGGTDACLYPPGAPLVLADGAYTYDTRTDGGTLSGPSGVLRTSSFTFAPADGPATAVLSIDALTIGAGATISVVGTKPLLVLVWSALAIDGTIDASSRRSIAQLGAGANEGCTTTLGLAGANAAPAGSGGSGGGGGAGFQGVGGHAGDGGKVAALGGAGGAVAPAALRGGCPGGASGTAGSGATAPSTAGTQALGGAGGGALRLIAHDMISVGGSATVSANGAGGAGAPLHSACGGGGGGAGGYLAFEAPVVKLDGTVTANGGGGGGGGGPTDAGNAGEDGTPGVIAARGGAISSTCGEPGGDGSDAVVLDGLPGTTLAAACTATGGGGGGGGASGYIVVTSSTFTSATSAKLAPPVLRP